MLRARPLPAALRVEIATVLSQPEIRLFDRFSPSDQWHGYQVLRSLQAAGHDHPDLLAAALLHDIGKTWASLSLWDRSLVVLVEALFPEKAAAWGNGGEQGWKLPFVVKARHPEWGAQMAQAAGSRPLTVTLIGRHQESQPSQDGGPIDPLLRALQWADNLN
jgi:hypothetical protein